jgi:hypothetical protein
MNRRKFVEIIRRIVLEATAKSTAKILKNPPGRRPRRELVELSHWYQSLSDSDKEMVEKLLSAAAHQAVFGMLAVIDGARVIDEGTEKGKLELFYLRGEKRLWLNPPDLEPLHDILNQMVQL